MTSVMLKSTFSMFISLTCGQTLILFNSNNLKRPMFPAVEGHKRLEPNEEEKKDEITAEKNLRITPELANSTSTSKL